MRKISTRFTIFITCWIVLTMGAALAQSAEPITINFWHSLGSGVNGEAIKAMVQRFNETNPYNIVVVETFQGNYNDASAKLQQSLAARTNPEVAMLDRALIPQYAPYGVLEDMLPYATRDNVDLDDFVEGLMAFSYFDGKLLSLPFNRSTPVMYYNKDAFAEVGLDPERPPTTWEELFEYAAKLTKVENGQTVRYGFSMVIDAGWFLSAMVGQQGGIMINEAGDTVEFTRDGTGLEALKFWRKLADSGYYRIPATTNAGTVMIQEFYQGKIAMMYASTGDLGAILRNTEGEGLFDLGVAFLPKNKQHEVPTGGANLVMLANVPKEKKEAAWEFIKFATSAQETAQFSLTTGYLPTRKSAVESDMIQSLWRDHPQYKVAFDQLQYAIDTTKSPYFWEFNSMMNQIISSLIQDRSITPEEAIARMEAEAARLFPGNAR